MGNCVLLYMVLNVYVVCVGGVLMDFNGINNDSDYLCVWCLLSFLSVFMVLRMFDYKFMMYMWFEMLLLMSDGV